MSRVRKLVCRNLNAHTPQLPVTELQEFLKNGWLAHQTQIKYNLYWIKESSFYLSFYHMIYMYLKISIFAWWLMRLFILFAKCRVKHVGNVQLRFSPTFIHNVEGGVLQNVNLSLHKTK